MTTIKDKEKIINPLLLLIFFSMQFIGEIMSQKTKGSVTDDPYYLVFDSGNILLIIVPILVYFFLKEKDKALKIIYLLSILPFLLSSTIVNFLNIWWLDYLNITILFVMILYLVKYLIDHTYVSS